MKNNNISKLFLIVFFFSFSLIHSQEYVNFVTYGPKANPREGDNDFNQVFFLEIDDASVDSVLVEIFDADCFGEHDQSFRDGFNSEFKFWLYGGKGCYTAETIKSESPKYSDLYKGNVIKSLFAKSQKEYDNKWAVFAEIKKTDGELVDGKYYFKVVIEGISGDDSNVFNLRATSKNNKKIRITNYAPTIHLLAKMAPAQMRFNSADNDKLIINNYDADNANILWKSHYTEGEKLKSSGDGNWETESIELKSFEKNEICAVQFGPGGIKNNDAIFYITNELGKVLPIELPIYTVIKNNRPDLKLDVNYTKDCYRVLLDASNSEDEDENMVNAKWILNDGSILNGLKQELEFDKTGDYKTILAIKDDSKSMESGRYKEFIISINEPPIANAGKDRLNAPNETIKFDAGLSSDKDGRIIKYTWDFGDGFQAEGEIQNHKYEEPGIYNVILTVEDNGEGLCTKNSDAIKVSINSKPIANAGKDIACSIGESIDFDGTASYDNDGKIISYSWDYGDGSAADGVLNKHSYKKAGVYKVSLKVVDNSGTKNSTDIAYLNVTVNSPPIAMAGNDIEIAVDETFTLDASLSSDKDGQIVEYIWSCENEFNKNGKRVQHSFSKPGIYEIKLTVKDNSSTNSNIANDYKKVIVNSQPIANAGNNVNQTDAKVTFDASQSDDLDGNIVSYKWDFGDGNYSSKKVTEHYYRNSGEYKVRLIVQDNSPASNNKSEVEKNVVINSKPIADAGPDLIVAPNEEFTLSSTNSFDSDGKISSSVWTLGNKVISNEQSFIYSFPTSGKKTIQLKVVDNAESFDYDNVIIKVNESPKIVTEDSHIIALGETITLDASKSFDNDGEIINYKWSLNGEVLGTDKYLAYKFKEGGKYKLLIAITDNSKVSNSVTTKEIEVFVNNSPNVKVIQDINTCENNVMFSAVGTFDQDDDKLGFNWDFGDGNSAYGENVEHTYSTPGVYPVKLLVDDGNNLKNSTSKTELKVKINTAPIANAGVDEVICSGDIITLDASKSNDADGDLLKYYWDFGDSTYGSGMTVNKNYVLPGIYTVKLTVRDNTGLICNSSVDTKIIRVIESPVAFAGEDIKTCSNMEVSFNAYKSTDSDGIVNSFEWDFGDGNKGGGEKTTHVYKKAGVYNVVLTITGELTLDCDNVDTDELIVTVEDAPLAEFTFVDSVAVNKEINFSALPSDGKGNSIANYLWSFGDGNSGTGKEIRHKYSESGSYFVELKIITESNAECNTSKIKKVVYVNDAPIAIAGKDLSVDVNELFMLDASASYDPNGKIKKYLWNFGNGITKEGINVFHSFDKSGNYSVELKVFDETKLSNNYAVDKLTINVNEQPSGTIVTDEYGLVGTKTKIELKDVKDSDGKVENIYWNIDGYLDSAKQNIEYTFTKTGKYDIVCKLVDNKKSTNVISKSITIYDLPIITLSNFTTCINWPNALKVDYSFQNSKIEFPIQWIFDDGKKYEGNAIDVTFVKSGKQKVIVNLMNPLKSEEVLVTSSFDIFVNQSPVAKISSVDESYIGGANDNVLFDASKSEDADEDVLTYEWDFGDGNSAFGEKVLHVYDRSGEYKVKLTVNDERGSSCSKNVVSKQIKIIKR